MMRAEPHPRSAGTLRGHVDAAPVQWLLSSLPLSMAAPLLRDIPLLRNATVSLPRGGALPVRWGTFVLCVVLVMQFLSVFGSSLCMSSNEILAVRTPVP